MLSEFKDPVIDKDSTVIPATPGYEVLGFCGWNLKVYREPVIAWRVRGNKNVWPQAVTIDYVILDCVGAVLALLRPDGVLVPIDCDGEIVSWGHTWPSIEAWLEEAKTAIEKEKAEEEASIAADAARREAAAADAAKREGEKAAKKRSRPKMIKAAVEA